jgi:hypothetical protein
MRFPQSRTNGMNTFLSSAPIAVGSGGVKKLGWSLVSENQPTRTPGPPKAIPRSPIDHRSESQEGSPAATRSATYAKMAMIQLNAEKEGTKAPGDSFLISPFSQKPPSTGASTMTPPRPANKPKPRPGPHPPILKHDHNVSPPLPPPNDGIVRSSSFREQQKAEAMRDSVLVLGG